MAVKRVLIANRGEVALRILQALHELEFAGVVVAAADEAGALAVRKADGHVLLEGETLAETYLNGPKILAAARTANCSMIHPGFGFLSESAEFAQSVQDAGLTWIGPPPKAMRQVADKMQAKETARKLKIPVLDAVEIKGAATKKDLEKIHQEIGFPVLLKAVAGGGGKGHKIVEDPKQFESQLASAQREAKNAFGDERVFVERLILSPRHLEIQIFGDAKGEVRAFGERDCSVQRRFQKIIEESPAPGLSAEKRRELEDQAIKLAKHVGYRNAGTVEFLYDAERDEAYFMEMNARLQVEHGVTEERYGIDLVKMQILTALGQGIEELLPQGPPLGHIVELRLYAEDPAMKFLPQSGLIQALEFPLAKGLRVESGIQGGDTITDRYDPMIAKVLVRGATRLEALDKAKSVLRETRLLGPTTNRDFLGWIMGHEGFRRGGVTTRFVQDEIAGWDAKITTKTVALALAKALAGNISQVRKGAQTSLFSELQFGREVL